MVHPIQSMVESLNSEGSCPRLHVNVTYDGVVCPEFIREEWQEQLVIDLDPSYPLDLVFTEDGVEVDLSFKGFVTRCIFPWKSIYVVADRDGDKGLVIEENMPESVRLRHLMREPKFSGDLSKMAKRKGPGESRRRKRRRSDEESVDEAKTGPLLAVEDKPVLAVQTETVDETSNSKVEEPDKSTKSVEKEAQRRRSVFKVIDGGG